MDPKSLRRKGADPGGSDTVGPSSFYPAMPYGAQSCGSTRQTSRREPREGECLETPSDLPALSLPWVGEGEGRGVDEDRCKGAALRANLRAHGFCLVRSAFSAADAAILERCEALCLEALAGEERGQRGASLSNTPLSSGSRVPAPPSCPSSSRRSGPDVTQRCSTLDEPPHCTGHWLQGEKSMLPLAGLAPSRASRLGRRRRWFRGAAGLPGACKAELAQLRECEVERRPSTRQKAACAALPLTGIGLRTVMDGGERVREQLHLVTDERALQLVPWPTGRHGRLREAVLESTRVLQKTCEALLRELEPEADRIRQEQAHEYGDPSVLDVFLYPNESKRSAPNMHTHTDPGLLTITLVSETPGLQVLDAQSGSWVDVEALAEPASLVVMCGESIELMSRGTYPAAPHRVRRASAPRLSVVFELRIHQPSTFQPLAQGVANGSSPRSESDAAASLCGGSQRRSKGVVMPGHWCAPQMDLETALDGASASSMGKRTTARHHEPVANEDHSGLDYVRSFVQGRLDNGSTVQDVLGEFGISAAHAWTLINGGWPDAHAHQAPSALNAMTSSPHELSSELLAKLVLRWVVGCREREEAAASFADAEYVTIKPAFADCTGKFVEVSWSPMPYLE